jgi:hypothetical protein
VGIGVSASVSSAGKFRSDSVSLGWPLPLSSHPHNKLHEREIAGKGVNCGLHDKAGTGATRSLIPKRQSSHRLFPLTLVYICAY